MSESGVANEQESGSLPVGRPSPDRQTVARAARMAAQGTRRFARVAPLGPGGRRTRAQVWLVRVGHGLVGAHR